MISYIEGEIISKDEESLSVATKLGVGYEIFIGENRTVDGDVGEKVSFFTHLKVGENDMQLYGFESAEEKIFFKLLISVSGLGPKSAMRVLSLGSMNEIKSAIEQEDKDYLTAVKGIGKKTAGRMIVELKSKVDVVVEAEAASQDGSKIKEVISALSSMGYSKQQAKKAVKGIKTEDKNIQQILKQVLKNIG